MFGKPVQGLENLLPTLKTQVSAARYQEEGQDLRCKPGEQKRDRQNNNQLVDQRGLGDFPDNWQLALGGKSGDVLRSDSGVIDDDANRFGRYLHRA